MPVKLIVEARNAYSSKNILKGIPMKEYIEERAVGMANDIIDCNAAVWQVAKRFGLSKSKVYMIGMKF